MKQALESKAQATIAANLIETMKGRFFVAGGHQFKTMWVRDFCYSVPGLIRAGHLDIVTNQLDFIISHQDQNGFLPRGFDVISPKIRTAGNVLLPEGLFEKICPIQYGSSPLKPEYLGEHRTYAYDSNLLCILAAEAVYESGYFQQVAAKLLEPYGQGDLVQQPAFSDWQDSARREGCVLLTQVLRLKALHALKRPTQDLQKAIIKNFFSVENNLFKEFSDRAQFSLDSHVFILTDPQLFPQLDKASIYKSLKTSALWNSASLPGVPIYPNYPNSEVSWTTKVVGLRHYHDQFVWGWLAAEAYKLARHFGDAAEAERILATFHTTVSDQPWLAEIYLQGPHGLQEYRGRIYATEAPFTWTAAKWMEAL